MSGQVDGLTVIVPCLNESGTLRRMYDEVTAALAQVDGLELLLIDDGSTDDTLAQMQALAAEDPRVRYLSLTRNGGLEAAQSAGFRYASRPWVAQLDCDLQFPPSEIPRMLAKAAEGYDVVFGVRANRQDPWWRRWGSSAQHWVARRLFGIALPVGASTFRVVRTSVGRTISELRLGSPYFLATVPVLGARYATVPVAHHRRPGGGSRFRLTRLFGHSFELLFGHSWRPLNASYLLAAIGVAAAVAVAGLGGVGILGPSALGVSAVLLAGATLATVALVGRYLHRLLRDQQRPRPYYIREANVPLHPEDRIDGGADRAPVPLASGQNSDPTPPSGRKDGPLLVLGASDDQLLIYREARRRGVYTIAVDKRSDLPALSYADEHLAISIRDPEAIIAALGDRVPRGVVASGGELGVWSWHRLSEHYDTAYRFPRSAAVASTDKAAFHAVAAAAGVNTYRWRHSTDASTLMAGADEVGFPLVVKPADGSGKRGIQVVEEPEQLPAALAEAAGASYTGGLLIEQRLQGRDLSVDLFMRDGQVAFSAIHEKITAGGGSMRVKGHISPAPLDEETRRRLVDTMALLCREIGLMDGPADFDVFVTEQGTIEVVEVNARMPGEAVPLLIQETYGVDLIAGLVSLVLGEQVELATPKTGRVGLLHMLASPLSVPGVLREVRGLNDAAQLPGVARCELYAAPGAPVPPFPQLGHEVGYLVVVGNGRAEADAALAAAVQRIEVDVVAAKPATTASKQSKHPVDATTPMQVVPQGQEGAAQHVT